MWNLLGGIYDWLNDNAIAERPAGDAGRSMSQGSMVDTFDPSQVFWGSHPFGSYRAQLGPELVRYQSLLEGLGVREKARLQ